MHGFENSLSLNLAPLSVIYLKYAPVKKRTPKPKTNDETAVKADEKKKTSGKKVSSGK